MRTRAKYGWMLIGLLVVLVASPAYGQALWRNFFTTNQNPVVDVVAGSNATVQATTVGVNTRRFTVNSVPPTQLPYTVITNAPWLPSNAQLTNQIYASNVVPFDKSKTVLVFEGDSLTCNDFGYQYWLTNFLGWDGCAFTTNAAHGGDSISSLTNQWATEIAPLSPGSGTNAVLLVWIGANDFLTADPYAFANTLSNYWSTAKSSNFTVVAFTVMPRASVTWGGDSTRVRTNHYIINQFIRGSKIWDYLIDVDSMFPDPYNLKNFSDGTHLTTNAHYVLAQKVDHVLRGAPHNFAGYPPSQYGTNVWFYGTNGSEIVGMNVNGYALQANGGISATSFTGSLDATNLSGSVPITLSGTLPWANLPQLTNSDYAPVALANLGTPAANHYPVMYCSDVVTSSGTGGYVRWNGSAWKTWENVTATANLTNFALNAWSAFLNVQTPISTIWANRQPPNTSTFGPWRAVDNASGDWTLSTSAAGYIFGGYDTSSSATGRRGAYGAFCMLSAGNVYSMGGVFAVSAACSGTETYWAMVGMHSSGTTTTPATGSGVYFIYDMYSNSVPAGAVADGAMRANWICSIVRAGSAVYFDSGLPVSTSTGSPDRLAIVFTTAAASFYTNGVVCKIYDTAANLPAVSMFFSNTKICKAVGTTSRKLYEALPYSNTREASVTVP